MIRKLVSVALLSALTAIMTSCASTTFIKTWKDAHYNGPVKKVFVVSIDKDLGRRTLIEKEFVRQFKAHGIDAVSSTEVTSDAVGLKREMGLSKAVEFGADGMLVVKFIKKETEETFTPQEGSGVPLEFNAENEALFQFSDEDEQATSYVYNVATIQLTLYNSNTKKAIWSARSKTKYRGSRIDKIKPFVNAVLGKLADDSMIN